MTGAAFPHHLLACPRCAGALDVTLACGPCERRFSSAGGVLRMLPEQGASNVIVQDFYGASPFPDYEDLDSPRALRERAAASRFAKLLDEQLPLSGCCLEAGCGTGQLTNFLALSHRQMIGVDFCSASLELATGFRDRFAISHAHFVQADLFALPFQRASFETIVSIGVLHHTADPERAFCELVYKLKPGGHIVLGLYNRYARLPTAARRSIGRVLGKRCLALLDPVVRRQRASQRRRRAWLLDQYFHPLEKTHTVDEVLRWFAHAEITYVNAVPKIVFGETFVGEEDLFARGLPGSALDHLVQQCGWMFTHGWEGGLFIMIGRKAELGDSRRTA